MPKRRIPFGQDIDSSKYDRRSDRMVVAGWRKGALWEPELWSGVEEFREYLAGFANLYFFFLVGVFGTIAKSAGHIPAHMTAIKFPGRALFFHRAEFFLPAAHGAALATSLVEIEKIEEFFGMGGNGAPPLFVAMDGLERDTKQLSELLLGFAHFFSDELKIFSIHGRAPFKANSENEMEIPISTEAYHILAL
jgi:hypothetical protein